MKRLIALIAVLGAALALPHAANAHGASPLYQETVQAGPYAFSAGFFNWPVRSEQAAELLLTPADARYGHRELAVQVWLVPQPGTPGEAAQLAVRPDPDSANGYSVAPRPAVKGDWSLQILVVGPAGNGQATMALPVSGPPSIPVWLGWTVGLLPAFGLAIFGLSQARSLAARRTMALNRPLF